MLPDPASMILQSQAASPWPEVPLSPKTPPPPDQAAGSEWHAVDMRASHSISIPEDDRLSTASGEDAAGIASHKTLVSLQCFPSASDRAALSALLLQPGSLSSGVEMPKHTSLPLTHEESHLQRGACLAGADSHAMLPD